MSAGLGRAERSILEAIAAARSPLGAPLWLTIDEIAEAACYRLPLLPAERDSLRRAARRLSVKGLVLTAKAGDHWTATRRVASSVLRPDLPRGTVLVRTLSTQRQGSDQAVSRTNTELVEGEQYEALPPDLRRPASDVPQGLPLSAAGDTAEDIESAALILNGTSRTRVTRLQTDKPPLVTEGSAPPDTSPAPRPFSTSELQAMGFERESGIGGDRFVRRHDDGDPAEGWEILDDPAMSGEEELVQPEDEPYDDRDDLEPWEREMIEAGELDSHWRWNLYQPPADVRPKWAQTVELEPADCVRCGERAVKAGACATHLCENCHEQPWHAKRLCSACLEYARVHKGAPRPQRLWGRTRKVDQRGRKPRK